MPPTNAATFDRQREQVEAMLSAGAPFGVVEETINGSPLNEHQKAGLWLLAWSSQPPHALRENLRATLALLAGTDGGTEAGMLA